MSLTDRLTAPLPADRTHGPVCGVDKQMRTLPPAEADALRQLLDGDTGHTTLARVLQEEGVALTYQQVARHRRGLCACGRR